jgi:hypothetical protein
MLNHLIQTIADKYSCEQQDIKVGPLFQQSVFIELGPNCQECTNSVRCTNDLVDKITSEFKWITQVKIF